jgi:hypothetical protein
MLLGKTPLYYDDELEIYHEGRTFCGQIIAFTKQEGGGSCNLHADRLMTWCNMQAAVCKAHEHWHNKYTVLA